MSKVFILLHPLLLIVGLLAPAANLIAEVEQETFVDSIVASVNGNPITLRELSSRLKPERDLTLSEASSDPDVQYTLDLIILEELIKQEAKKNRLSVGPDEIDRYLGQVAARNNMTREEFEGALSDQNQSIEHYRQQIELEILKSKLASNLVQGGSGVTEREIQKYIEDHPELSKSGDKLKLSQIFVATASRSPAEAQKLMSFVQTALDEGGEFSAVARKFSESSEGASGGSLGVVAEADLSPVISNAVTGLEEGAISQVTRSPAGLHLFRLDKRFVESGESQMEQLALEVRKVLEEQKLQSKMQTYFTTELFKLHSVDKKI